MSKNLLIVESPAKAKTIEKLLGKDFTVRSSYGHIRDLVKDSKDQKAIDVANNYQMRYTISPEKLKVVRSLREDIKGVEKVWLATDEDREGEAIAWHLAQVLNLDVTKTARIAFREITKPALLKAVQSPRLVDIDLVNAQQARRALDRLVGFELSELLWKKVKGGLSAGRVQSVAVRLVVEKEREIQSHQTQSFYRIAAIFDVKTAKDKSTQLRAQHPRHFETEAQAREFLEACRSATFCVANISVKPATRTPAAPFTTSTLQQEASRKMGYSVSRTMSVAQSLYEGGHITYMRTDSTTLSEEAINSIAQTVEQMYGQQYVHSRQYKSKNASAQEAHEAIRPTYPNKSSVPASMGTDAQRLYELIWKRTTASQMQDAKLERTVVDIAISSLPKDFLQSVGEVIKFDGFLKVYLEDNDEEPTEEGDDSALLPPLKVGQNLPLKDMTATQRFTKAAARFTEASLVKKLEELGIGRPSTYASIISKIMEDSRGYVSKENREGSERDFKTLTLTAATNSISEETKKEKFGTEKQKLFASDVGMVVTDFLNQHFDAVMDYRFTASVEQKLDEVAEGKADWIRTIDDIYKPFHKIVAATAEEAERATGERILGKHPQTGRTVLTRVAKYGPLVQIGTTEELKAGEKPLYANLQAGQSIEGITLEEALKLFQLPKTLGTHKGEEIIVSSGRFGAYLKYGKANINLPKDADPMTVDIAAAILLIEQRLAADAPIGYYREKPITKGSGKFGPFVKWNDNYYSLPKKADLNLATITEAQAIQLIEEKQQKDATKYIQSWVDLDLHIENGRWGPFIRYGKKNFKLVESGVKLSADIAAVLTLKQVAAIVAEQGEVIPAKKIEAAMNPNAATTSSSTAEPSTEAPAKKTRKKKGE